VQAQERRGAPNLIVGVIAGRARRQRRDSSRHYIEKASTRRGFAGGVHAGAIIENSLDVAAVAPAASLSLDSGLHHMNDNTMLRTGGQILVDCLKTHGVDTAFCVPGESYLAVLDALYDAREQVRLIVCRQEGGAAFMAEAYGKLRGRPGICFVTRGPGATNAAIGVHTAFQDSSPMILFI